MVNWSAIITTLFILLLLVSLFPTIDSGFGKVYNCKKTEIVPYRYVGTGGLFGGKERVETTKELSDGEMEICVKWDGFFLKSNGGYKK